jgi:type IV secretion system protein VirD4
MTYAHWEKENEIKKALTKISLKEEIQKSGIPVVYDGNNCYITKNDAHTLVVGSTGSGKTQTIILPLIKLSMLANESLVINDVKGDLYVKTASEFKKRGYKR